MTITTLHGDCRAVLQTLPAGSVQCVVTSPPYYGLRKYGDDPREIGQEATPGEYVAALVEVFHQARRVLRDDGCAWINLGDSYGTGSGGNGTASPKQQSNAGTQIEPRAPLTGMNKQLLGIPWRVAFALQQPYEKPHLIKRESDRAWLAAIVDGEGCIGIRRFVSHSNGKGEPRCQDGFVPYLTIGNNDRELLDRCVEITGYGSVGIKDRPTTDSRGINSRRDNYGWRLDGNKAMDVIRDIYPYLIVKRKQAVIVHNLDLSNKNGKSLRGNGALPKDEQEKREYLKDAIHRCNQREPVDLPSWFVDIPPVEVEPGWILRSDVIWNKPNCMPESVTDRPTRAHEYLFLLAKSARYFYDAAAIEEESAPSSKARAKYNGGAPSPKSIEGTAAGVYCGPPTTGRAYGQGRNKRSVWTIATQPYSGAHYATMPEALIAPCILAGSSAQACEHCGAAWGRVVEKGDTPWEQRKEKGEPTRRGSEAETINAVQRGTSAWNGQKQAAWKAEHPDRDLGFAPRCACPANTGSARSVVLDPFSGSGTVSRVAMRYQRDAIGIELNQDYIDDHIETRTDGVQVELFV